MREEGRASSLIPVYSLQDLKIHMSSEYSQAHRPDNRAGGDTRPLDERTRHLARRLECSELVAAILASRNLEEEEIRELLFAPSLRQQLDELFLGEAAEVTRRLWRDAVPGKKVFVWGDYDVDGVSSTVVALELAQECGAAEAVYYIPDRRSEGYGLHAEQVRSVIADGFDTLIVVDCGSKDTGAVELAKNAGMNVMIFDHHAAEGEIVRLPSLLNPQIDGNAASHALCATAVLWCWAWQSKILPPSRLMDLLQLVALATVSDCMSLTSLNRTITREGIAMMRNCPRRGLCELLRAMCPDEPYSMIDEQKLAMKIIPCLNAAGRVQVADVAVNVLSGRGDQAELDGWVAQLLELNRRRRDISTAICASVNTMMTTAGSTAPCKGGTENPQQVLFNASWPVGILSAVASRLCCEHNKAFALSAPSGSRIRGTLRVPEGANAVELLKELDDLLEAWGGHKSAAGFSVSHVKWQRFSRELDRRLKEITVERTRVNVLEMEPDRITPSAWNDLLRLGPFGNGNPSPLFFVPVSSHMSYAPLGKRGQHVRILCGGSTLLAFNAPQTFSINDDKVVINSQLMHDTCAATVCRGWLYRPRQNYWQGRVSLQFVVEGIVVD